MESENSLIIATAITELAKDAARSIRDVIFKYIKDESAKAEIDYGDAFEQYLKTASEKNSKLKTLIYRHEPKDLEAIYECVGVSLGTHNIDTRSIHNLLEVGHKIIITGTGGVGKSTLIKHLFLNTIVETAFIPILVELRGINSIDTGKIELEDLICLSLKNYGMTMKKEYFCL